MSTEDAEGQDGIQDSANGSLNAPFLEAQELPGGRTFAVSREEYAFEDDDEITAEEHGSRRQWDRPTAEEVRQLNDMSDSTDYYNLLGLYRSSQPNAERIRLAHRTLSLSFHPDKQPPHLRNAAREHFSKIQEAYETLIDPKKRVVYDLLGEEGVTAEWGVGGSMGRGGEAQGQQVGVKAMNATDFRRWFIAVMRARERKALENMVGSTSHLAVGVSLIPLFQRSIKAPAPESSARRHLIQLSSFRVGHAFKAPTDWLEWLWYPEVEGDTPQAYDNENAMHTTSSQSRKPELIISASIAGKATRLKRELTFNFQDSDEHVTQKIEMPPVITSRMFSLDSSLSYALPETSSEAERGLIRSLFSGAALELGVAPFPKPLFRSAIAQTFTPIKGTKPFLARIQASFTQSVSLCAPVVDVFLRRSLGVGRGIYLTWTSAQHFWSEISPRVIAHLIESGGYPPPGGKIAMGYSSESQDTNSATQKNSDSANESEPGSKNYQSAPMASWGLQLEASQEASQLTFNYARNIFAGSGVPPLRSEWSHEGHRRANLNLVADYYTNPVRLEVQVALAPGVSPAWLIKGTRRVGNLTYMGIGVGVQGENLALTVTWNRLGQSIYLPVAVCPAELVNADFIKLAIALPWVTFMVLEFGFLRPRARRQWTEEIQKRRAILIGRVPGKKIESAQAIELMTSQVKLRQSREAKRNGLAILYAEYGVMRTERSVASFPNPSDRMAVDVTIPIAALVEKGQLSISRRVKKRHILGFYDPAPLTAKRLHVRYLFAGAEHVVDVAENEDLVCPMREHRIS